MLKDTVAKFAKETIGPHVRRMDETASMDPSIIKACFDNGAQPRKGHLKLTRNFARQFSGPDTNLADSLF